MVSFDHFLARNIVFSLECLVSYSSVLNSLLGTICDVFLFAFWSLNLRLVVD